MEIISNNRDLQENCSVLYHLQKWRANKENNCPHIPSDHMYTLCKQNEIIYQWINNYREDIESNVHIFEFTHTLPSPDCFFKMTLNYLETSMKMFQFFQVHRFYTFTFFFFGNSSSTTLFFLHYSQFDCNSWLQVLIWFISRKKVKQRLRFLRLTSIIRLAKK